jgi:hypothetical protein
MKGFRTLTNPIAVQQIDHNPFMIFLESDNILNFPMLFIQWPICIGLAFVRHWNEQKHYGKIPHTPEELAASLRSPSRNRGVSEGVSEWVRGWVSYPLTHLLTYPEVGGRFHILWFAHLVRPRTRSNHDHTMWKQPSIYPR